MKIELFYFGLLSFAVLTSGCDYSEEEFIKAENIGTVEAYQRFLREYPDSRFTDSATTRVESLAYEKVARENTEQAYFSYYNDFPKSVFAKESLNKAASIAYGTAKKENAESAYLAFLQKYSGSDYEQGARNEAATLRYEHAVEEYSEDAFQTFIADYPGSNLIESANNRIDDIRSSRYVAATNTFISYDRLRKVFGWDESFRGYVCGDVGGMMSFTSEGRLLKGDWCLGNLKFIRSVVLQEAGIVLHKGSRMIYPKR